MSMQKIPIPSIYLSMHIIFSQRVFLFLHKVYQNLNIGFAGNVQCTYYAWFFTKRRFQESVAGSLQLLLL